MLASKYGKAASGHKKFWVARGSDPEQYCHGPFDDRQEAEDEARQLMADDKWSVATIGEGEEVELNLPDADDLIETMTEGLYEQCGEVGADYLDRSTVSREQGAELTEAVEKAVADWFTKHGLWPTFCKVEEVATLRSGTEESS